MIDLEGFCIKNDRAELRELFVSIAIKQGFKAGDLYKLDCDKSYICCNGRIYYATNSQPSSKLLTLADLKPRAKPFLQTGEAFEHTKTLNFILERLINVHSENENVDYIHKLRNAIIFTEQMEEPTAIGAIKKQKPQVKVEYVKCEFSSIWEGIKAMEVDKEVFFVDGDTSEYPYVEIGNVPALMRPLAMQESIYRKVECELTWRDAAADFLGDYKTLSVKVLSNSIAYEIESGNSELQNEFIKMCKLVTSMTK